MQLRHLLARPFTLPSVCYLFLLVLHPCFHPFQFMYMQELIEQHGTGQPAQMVVTAATLLAAALQGKIWLGHTFAPGLLALLSKLGGRAVQPAGSGMDPSSADVPSNQKRQVDDLEDCSCYLLRL